MANGIDDVRSQNKKIEKNLQYFLDTTMVNLTTRFDYTAYG